ncbi:MAG: permease [Caldimicrobium sp.]|nr:permease [Caldimicrobium sp.]MDW8095133.1 permease [Caldimicrobium sp.]
MYKFFSNFWEYSVEIIPYFLLAVFVTSVLKVYLGPNHLKRALASPKSAPLLTGLLAGLLPVCSCSVVPLAYFINNLSRNYAPVLSFLMIGPVISPVSIFLTLGLLGIKFTLFRLLFTFILSFVIAYLSLGLFKKNSPSLEVEYAPREKGSFKMIFIEFKGEALSIGKYLLIGLIIASLMVTFLNPESLKGLAGHPWAYFLIAIISIPIYVCSGEEVPIAKALMEVGLTSGQAMVFVLAGSGICLPTVTAVLKFLPLKLVIYYVTSWFILALLGGLLFDYIF